MSTTYPAWPLTTYPDALDKNNTSVIRQGIVNFEDRTTSTDPTLYYVIANDVKALQQAVFSLQETLGVAPQLTYGSVSARMTALENYEDLDIRYGGALWGAIPDGLRPTILGHLHDGSGTGAPKIDVGLHVTGKLKKANINLVRTDATAITGEDIAVSASTDQTIASRFNDKLDKTGGTITGSGAQLVVNGPFNSRIYKEADAKDCIPSSGATGTSVADAIGAFSGTAVRGTPANAAGDLVAYTSTLRYGDYSLGLRMRVSSIASIQGIGKVKVYSGTTLMNEVVIVPSDFAGTEYQMFYVGFTHKNDWNVKVNVSWYGPAAACDLTIDSLVITPLHITAYDKE